MLSPQRPEMLSSLILQRQFANGKNILHEIASQTHDEVTLENFKEILNNENPNLLNHFLKSKDDQGKTPLHIAIDSGNEFFIKNLVDFPFTDDKITPFIKVQSHSREASGQSPSISINNNPLHYATFSNPNIIPLLFEKFPTILEQTNSQGYTPAGLSLIAFRKGNLPTNQALQEFIKYSPNQKAEQDNSLLNLAIRLKDFKSCELILNSPQFDLTSSNAKCREKAFHSIVRTLCDSEPGTNFEGLANLFKKLIEKGADINEANSFGKTAGDILAKSASEEVNLRNPQYPDEFPPRDQNLTQIKQNEIKEIFKIILQKGVEIKDESFLGNPRIKNIYEQAKKELDTPQQSPSPQFQFSEIATHSHRRAW